MKQPMSLDQMAARFRVASMLLTDDVTDVSGIQEDVPRVMENMRVITKARITNKDVPVVRTTVTITHVADSGEVTVVAHLVR